MAFEDGTAIIRQGSVGDTFYIVFEGNVNIYVDKGDQDRELVQKCSPGNYFGERALLSEDTRAATCIAEGKVVCLTLDRPDFEKMIGSLKEYSDGRRRGRDRLPMAARTESQVYADKEIQWNDLEVVGMLGDGAFGRVSLVKNKNIPTGPDMKTYALKAMQKRLIQDRSLEEHTLNEIKVMKACKHPVLLKLYNAFQDEKRVYLLIELCQGGELFDIMQEKGPFKESHAKFYAASVTLGFEHLHNLKVCYRDLKPENLLLDSQGFLKICDFGLSKVVMDKTYTMCGTPDYLAPEIILSEGHNKAADYWALGILIYETIIGEVPFYADDPMDIYQQILRHHLSFPYFKPSKVGKDIVRALLVKEPRKRIGNLIGGTSDIIKHKWFQGFDFEALVAQDASKFDIPIRPVIKDTCDTSNFDISVIEPEQTALRCNWKPPGFKMIPGSYGLDTVSE